MEDCEDWKFFDSLRHEDHELSAGRIEDSHHHYILVNLPDVRKGGVKVHVTSQGHIAVSGEKKVDHHASKYVHFEHIFNLPPNAETAGITGEFQDELVYCIKIPKIVTFNEQEPQEPQRETVAEPSSNSNRSNGEVPSRKKKDRANGKDGGLQHIIAALSGQMGIVITAALAFSLGVLFSRKFESTR